MAEIKTSEELFQLYYDICRQLGAPEEEAEVVAKCTLRADLRGIYTQGSSVFPYLVELVEKKLMTFDVPFKILNDQPSMAVVNGSFGVGGVMATKSMDIAIEKAGQTGIGTVWLQHGGDFMMASNHVLQAIDQGMMGIVMRNGSPLVAPFGGREKFFGTNPISFGVPSENEHPIVVDMASGSFSQGRVVMAARDKQKMPSKHLVDRDGNYTDDAASLVIDPIDRESDLDGGIVSLGHKGYGWMMLVELMAGVLSGMGTSNLNDYTPTEERPWNEGIFFMAIDVSKIMNIDMFKATIDGLVQSLNGVKPANGFEKVYVPGEMEGEKEVQYKKEGIPVRDEDWKLLLGIAEKYEISIS